jgi:hypothetical protein
MENEDIKAEVVIRHSSIYRPHCGGGTSNPVPREHAVPEQTGCKEK